ncbi:MAG: GNAT family N-acetyltransferase [Capsulimonadales bacterium]|nr:GNAT family N-acetyltransferase [Capsulimonadales bacterium]
MQIELVPAHSGDRALALSHFFVAFFHDLSQFDRQIVVNRYGLPCWEPTLIACGTDGPKTAEECARFNWWVRDQADRTLFLADGVPAGFAIVLSRHPPLPDDVDHELMDFYIAPKFRRQGVGRIAARALFDRQPGRWQVFQLERNAPAIAFWHRVIGEYTGDHYLSLDNGTQQRFDNSDRAPAKETRPD